MYVSNIKHTKTKMELERFCKFFFERLPLPLVWLLKSAGGSRNETKKKGKHTLTKEWNVRLERYQLSLKVVRQHWNLLIFSYKRVKEHEKEIELNWIRSIWFMEIEWMDYLVRLLYSFFCVSFCNNIETAI